MKRKDILLLVVVAAMSAIISLIISLTVFVTPKNRQQAVEVVQPISAQFPTPDQKYFNKDSLNPTKLITINQNTNVDPFSAPKN